MTLMMAIMELFPRPHRRITHERSERVGPGVGKAQSAGDYRAKRPFRRNCSHGVIPGGGSAIEGRQNLSCTEPFFLADIVSAESTGLPLTVYGTSGVLNAKS